MSHEQHQELLQILHECMTACNHCYDACLQEDDIKMMGNCIRLDRECADICGYLEQAITRGTPFISELAAVCATISVITMIMSFMTTMHKHHHKRT
jgi:hypothetical protein